MYLAHRPAGLYSSFCSRTCASASLSAPLSCPVASRTSRRCPTPSTRACCPSRSASKSTPPRAADALQYRAVHQATQAPTSRHHSRGVCPCRKHAVRARQRSHRTLTCRAIEREVVCDGYLGPSGGHWPSYLRLRAVIVISVGSGSIELDLVGGVRRTRGSPEMLRRESMQWHAANTSAADV